MIDIFTFCQSKSHLIFFALFYLIWNFTIISNSFSLAFILKDFPFFVNTFLFKQPMKIDNCLILKILRFLSLDIFFNSLTPLKEIFTECFFFFFLKKKNFIHTHCIFINKKIIFISPPKDEKQKKKKALKRL